MAQTPPAWSLIPTTVPRAVHEPRLRRLRQAVRDRPVDGLCRRPWDNAVAESFFASLEKELLRCERFQTREQARLRIFWYIECFYNPRRRHSSLGYLSPIDYEHRHQQEALAA